MRMQRRQRRQRQRRGFTLTEVLIVIMIIVLIALAAVPAMRFIMGSRSIESAQNVVSAMVSRARNQAINDAETRGVFFFFDPVSDRSTMALVGQNGSGELGQYSGWTSKAGLPAPGSPNGPYVDPQGNVAFDPAYYAPGGGANTSTVISLSSSAKNGVAYFVLEDNSTYVNNVPRAVIRQYSCIQNHTNPNDSNYPKTTAGDANTPTQFWGQTSVSIDLVAATDFQTLPQGVGLQLINSNPVGIANFDRYVRLGCILFDGKGRFVSQPWSVSAGTSLGKAIGIDPNIGALDLSSSTGVQPLVSEFGIVLYDRQSFLAQPVPGGGNTFGEGDWIFSPNFTYPGYTGKVFFLPAYAPKFTASAADEQAINTLPTPPSKEQWLDANSLPLLIDRYNGTLIKGE
jgi:prepilin-type N-terminal cleavage/methylation domain-containing protein